MVSTMYQGFIILGILFISVIQVEMGKVKKLHLPARRTDKLADRRQDIAEFSKPVIGVLAQETSGKLMRIAQGQYVLGTYVSLLEAVGARVVPFLVNQTSEEVEELFNSINGLLLPGGHVRLQNSMYGRVGKQLYELAVKANDKGDVFPIWAECLGLELMALLASGRSLAKGQYDPELFDDVDARDLFLPLTLVGDWKKSTVYGSAPPDMVTFMTTKLKGYHNHFKAVTMKTFKKNKKLSAMFNVLSNNKDKKGRVYISTMEGKKYPFWLLHWHPSKAPNLAPESYDDKSYEEAIANAKYLYGIFVDKARKSKHKFNDKYELANRLVSQFPILMPMRDNVIGPSNLE